MFFIEKVISKITPAILNTFLLIGTVSAINLAAPAALAQTSTTCSGTGSATYQVWNNVNGTAVSDIPTG
ncbi:hypothetical protein, partial [Hymenobacter sp. B1770]|uniref:hypothetical protein n=1 Tax=Hymenobacter sp. B1770 TaxID=1718788 RepID=UPI003CE82531